MRIARRYSKDKLVYYAVVEREDIRTAVRAFQKNWMTYHRYKPRIMIRMFTKKLKLSNLDDSMIGIYASDSQFVFGKPVIWVDKHSYFHIRRANRIITSDRHTLSKQGRALIKKYGDETLVDIITHEHAHSVFEWAKKKRPDLYKKIMSRFGIYVSEGMGYPMREKWIDEKFAQATSLLLNNPDKFYDTDGIFWSVEDIKEMDKDAEVVYEVLDGYAAYMKRHVAKPMSLKSQEYYLNRLLERFKEYGIVMR